MLSDDATHLSNEKTKLSSQVNLSSLVHFLFNRASIKTRHFFT